MRTRWSQAAGPTRVYASEGDDIVYASTGDDLVYGGAGVDRFSFAAASGADTISGFNHAEGDVIDLQGQSYSVGQAADGDVLIQIAGGATIELDGITQFETSFLA